MHFLCVSGSLRSGSFNSALARAATALALPGTTCETVDLISSLPWYNQDHDIEPAPAPVQVVRQRIGDAAGVVFFTPEYNYGLPGGLKNLIDWASRPFGNHCLTGKPVAVIGAGPGPRGGGHAVEYLRMVLPALGAELVGDEVKLATVHEHLDEDLSTPSEELEGHLRTALEALAAAAAAKNA